MSAGSENNGNTAIENDNVSSSRILEKYQAKFNNILHHAN